MPRRMSFALTADAVRRREKTVTRRRKNSWRSLQVGDELLAVERVRGLKKGERQKVLARIRVTDVRVESLQRIYDEPDGTAAEGFPQLTASDFVRFLRRKAGIAPWDPVRRIQFEYLD